MSGSKRDRDRATEAFRRWARAGCPAAESIRHSKGAGDLRACAAVWAELSSGSGRANRAWAEIMTAVSEVYMAYPDRPLRRSDMTARVRRAAYLLTADERTVYRWLAEARRMWLEYRDSKTCQ